MQQCSLAAYTKGELGDNILPETRTGLLTPTSKISDNQSTYFYQKCKESFQPLEEGFSLNMQNELAELAGFMSVRSNTFKLGNVLRGVECLYTMHLFIYTEEMIKASKTQKYGKYVQKKKNDMKFKPQKE